MFNKMKNDLLAIKIAEATELPIELIAENIEDVMDVLSEEIDESSQETADKIGEVLELGKTIGEATTLLGGLSRDGEIVRLKQTPYFIFANDMKMRCGEPVILKLKTAEAKQVCKDLLNAIDAQEKGTFEEELETIGIKKSTYINGEPTNVEYIKENND
jgi:hypothetical protein